MDWYRQHFIFIPFTRTQWLQWSAFSYKRRDLCLSRVSRGAVTPSPGRFPQHRLPLQSFISTIPKMCSWALLMGMGSPNLFPGPTKNAWNEKPTCWLCFWSLKIFTAQRVTGSSNRGWTGWVLHHFPHTFGQNPWPAPLFFFSMKLAGLNYLRALCC